MGSLSPWTKQTVCNNHMSIKWVSIKWGLTVPNSTKYNDVNNIYYCYTWPAESLIFSTSGVPSESLKARMSFVISIRNESSSPLFQSANT